MIQKHGHIIAIDQAKVNAPLSGNGRPDSPIGLNLKLDDTLSGNGTTSKPLGVKSDLYVTNEDFAAYSAVPHAVVSSTDKNVTITPDFKDGVAYYDISFTADPIVSDTNILGVDGIRARWDSTTSAYYIGVSAKYLSANALNNYSGNWQSTYNTLNTNSAKWNEASAFSSNSGKFALKTDVDNKFTATSAWAKATFASASQLDYYYKKTETSARGELDTAFDKKQDKLTTAQLSAISSVSSIKSDLATHVNDTDIHIQNGEREKWNKVEEKVDTTAFNDYKNEVEQEFNNTSAWANATFQPIGEYLSANALDDLSGHWDSVYDSVFDNSASWNETSATLKENSGKWEESYTALTATSATWNNHSALSATKLDKDVFDTWKTDEFVPVKTDVETLKANSAHYSVESTNDYITVNSADHKFELTFVSGDLLATKTWVEEQLGAFGGYVPCEGTEPDNHPNVENPDPKKMYLVPKDDTTAPDRYYNWIVTGGETTGWLCVGDTSMDLTPYLKISDISGISGNWNTAYTYVTANSGNIAEASATAIDVSNTVNTYSSNWQESYEALTSTSADWNKTYTYVTANSANIESVSSTVNANSGKWNEASAFSANSGKFVTSGEEIDTAGLAYVLTKEGQTVAWSGVDLSNLGKMYPITSLTPDLVSATTAEVEGTPTYVLSAKEPEPFIQYSISASMMSAWTGIDNDVNYYFLSGANISGNNGISAEYNPEINQWDIGLNKTNLVTYARFHTSNNTYTTSAEITGFAQDDYIGTDIYLDNAEVYANSGLYHVDMQVGITVPGNDNNYHSTILKSTTAPSRQVVQEIDGSYAHTETISLSYDIRVATDATKLTYTIEDLPCNTTFFVKDLNVHRVICSLSEIGGSTYQAGDGLLLGNNTFSVDIGDGLEFSGNQVQVKLGDGLKFDENAGVGVKAITINNQVEEVVQSVQKMENDLDSKLTTNFPMPQIDNVYDFANDSISTISNGAGLICQAFTVPINNPIRLVTQDNPAGTLFGVYAKQGFTPKIMLALYVYDWTHTDYVADTGPIQIAAGRNEFPIKHINPNITELKSDCVYYAAIYIPAEARAQNGLSLAGCPSYAAASFINAIPRFTVRTENITGIDMSDPNAGLNILKPDSQTDYKWGPWTDSYNEQPTVPRFFMQIRNGTIN